MSPDAPGSFQIGASSFAPIVLLFPIVAALLVYLLGSICSRYRIARIPVLLIPVALGSYGAHSALYSASSYTAGYSFEIVYLVTGITAVGSALLLPLKISRRAGMLGIIAAVVIIVSFYATFLIGHRLGFYDWWGDQLVPIPPVEPRR